MNNHLKNGIIGGLSLAFVHLCWVAIVALGWGQALLELIFKLHMLKFDFQVQPFSALLAAELLALTFTVGFVMGLVFGKLAKIFKAAPEPIRNGTVVQPLSKR